MQTVPSAPVTQADLDLGVHMLASAGHYPSAIASLDAAAIVKSGADPFPALVAAVLADTRRPLTDLADFLPAEAYYEVEALMSAAGSAAVLEASR